MQKRLGLIFALVLTLSACAPVAQEAILAQPQAELNPASPDADLIAPESLLTLLDNEEIYLIDVRTHEEITETGLIADAIHIPLDELPDQLGQLPGSDTPIVVYCRSGRRAGTAQDILRGNGFSNVRNLDGGINAWLAAGYPVHQISFQGLATPNCEYE